MRGFAAVLDLEGLRCTFILIKTSDGPYFEYMKPFVFVQVQKYCSLSCNPVCGSLSGLKVN